MAISITHAQHIYTILSDHQAREGIARPIDLYHAYARTIREGTTPVSYTHLTLPTIYSV